MFIDGGSPGAKKHTGTKLQGFLTHDVTGPPVLEAHGNLQF